MLDINHISKSYGKKQALENITLQMTKGNCFGLIGPNGAGKSTLIKIIAGIISSDKGTVNFTGMPKRIGYVPQDVCLEESVTALQNLYFFGALYQLKGKHLKTQAEKILSVISLSEQKNDKVSTFSGGMKRRLNIGCALMNNPSLLIMDEPTVGIDPQSREHILQLVETMKTEQRIIIYSTHYMEEAERICDEVAFMDKGMMIKNEPMDNLLKSYAKPEIYFETDQPLQNTKGLVTSKHKDNKYTASTNNPMETIKRIIQLSEKNNVSITHLTLSKPKLEDIFFTLTGKALRDKGGNEHDSAV